MFLEIKNLKKIYFQKGKPITEALQGVSFDLQKGEIFGLLGVNGAGKTTLSSILASLHPPTSGQILWNGVSIYDNILSYRRIIGFCPQKPNLDRIFTLQENLIFSGRCYGMSLAESVRRKDELLEQLELTAYAQSYVDFLSGGYRQRFLIARTLMHTPELVILDEPTVGLDPHIRSQLWKVILSLKQRGATVLLTTHYLEEAEVLSDRVCIIDKGQVRLIDTPANLLKNYQKGKLEDVFLQLTQEENKNG
jgi:ABC-2 type transport system ATP-binding protein